MPIASATPSKHRHGEPLRRQRADEGYGEAEERRSILEQDDEARRVLMLRRNASIKPTSPLALLKARKAISQVAPSNTAEQAKHDIANLGVDDRIGLDWR